MPRRATSTRSETLSTNRVEEDRDRLSDLQDEVDAAEGDVHALRDAFDELMEKETAELPKKKKDRIYYALQEAFASANKQSSFLPAIDDDAAAVAAPPARGTRKTLAADLKSLVSRECLSEFQRLRGEMLEAKRVYDNKKAQLDLLQRKYRGLQSLSRLAEYGMCRGDSHIAQIRKALTELEAPDTAEA
eukprot:TRINITY_DN3907_c0_g2_i1.p5 TRINITY_DN3907_c0_g2~~TRINITY_DN3907_c0_g2_i1.p5  ORF type:complete len:189 (+),score=82.16 TRINITY_DN3907_c0_g2_i1:246-812(+)